MARYDLSKPGDRAKVRKHAESPTYRGSPLAICLVGALDLIEAMQRELEPFREAVRQAKADPQVGETFVNACRRADG